MIDSIGRTYRKASLFSSENWTRGWEVTALYSFTTVLIVFGLITLYSASSYDAQTHQLPDTYYFFRQLKGTGLGLIALIICSCMNYDIWRKLAWPILAVTWVLLIVLVLPGENTFAPEINGARR
ncbi:MAG: FtsW/RodA/SpoVE family cell cycle protein, partial [bacterium]